jgi:hypothetical protein
MINFTQNYFDLQLLKISNIRLHETTETKRLRNIFDRISKDRKLINPVIVAQHKGINILIDGANRLSSLEDIGCKLVLAQIINYNDNKIKLKCWNHLIYDFDLNIIRDYCETNGLKIKEFKYSDAQGIFKKSKNHLLASDTKNLKTLLIHIPGNQNSVVKELNDFTKLYFNLFNFDRSESEIKITDLKKYSRKYGILIEFPSFNKKDIITIASGENRIKIPAGITRHILVNRVLHVRYDIRNLLNEEDIVAKNKDLEECLIKKIDDNKVRQYKESVIVFDE